ncbi:hypothetical protein JAB6_01280 [Janthinobacterium sp. HH104]|nr:hypothetical protein JAB6_01280 [Janthinobacterium sp. HH104]
MALVPPVVVTRTSTVPLPLGAVAVICVALLTVKPVAAVAPKVTAVAPVKPVPVMVTLVPPAVEPAVGEMLVTVGAGIYVNWLAAPVALVPPLAVTVTFTVPATPAGDVAVMVVALTTVMATPLLAPNFSAVTPVKPVPVMVTAVPPVLGPDAGVTPVMVGGGWALITRE